MSSLRLVNEDGDIIHEISESGVECMLFDGRLNVGTRKAFARHLGLNFHDVMDQVSLSFAKAEHEKFMKEVDAVS